MLVSTLLTSYRQPPPVLRIYVIELGHVPPQLVHEALNTHHVCGSVGDAVPFAWSCHGLHAWSSSQLHLNWTHSYPRVVEFCPVYKKAIVRVMDS